MQRIVPTLLTALLFSSLNGCGGNTPPKIPPTDNTQTIPKINPADTLMASGEFEQAAQLYQKQAQNTDAQQRAVLQLKAADAWLQAKHIQPAHTLVKKIANSQLSSTQLAKKRLIEASIAIALRQIDQALQILATEPDDDAQKIQHYQLKAEAYQLNGNLLEQAHALSDVDQYLSNPERKIANQKAILKVLSKLTETALTFLQPPQTEPLAGWMELALVTKSLPFEAQEIAQKLQQWRDLFPNHPVDPGILSEMTEQIQAVLKPINQIALLLPQDGPFVNAANAFRDGFIAARYTHQGAQPIIKVYNTHGHEDIGTLYQRAVNDGASFVIGPLEKKNVRSLYQYNITTPVLALNYIDQTEPKAHFYQFSLSPEDEAVQAAERAWLDGYTTAITLTPANSFGKRVNQAFQTRWETLGGKFLEAQTYATKDRDFSEPIEALLNLDESEERYKTLSQRLGKIHFEPRRRADADFIFVAAKPLHARIIRPQLQFYRAQTLPIFTTSHVYSGTQLPAQDQDLEGIQFCDIPWILADDSEQLLSKDKLLALWPNISTRYIRLYAMGIDAYSLISQLPWLQANNQTYDGRTGSLSLDKSMKIHRQLVWAQFKAGIPELISYAPKIEEDTLAPPSQDSIEKPVFDTPLQ